MLNIKLRWMLTYHHEPKQHFHEHEASNFLFR